VSIELDIFKSDVSVEWILGEPQPRPWCVCGAQAVTDACGCVSPHMTEWVRTYMAERPTLPPPVLSPHQARMLEAALNEPA
jgi:hypothetical protein